MSLAPSIAEQYALYVEMFAFASGSLVLAALAVVVNWRVVRNMDDLVSGLLPKNFRGIPLQSLVKTVVARWSDQYRRVRRSITFMFAVALLGVAFADSTIITIAGSQLRSDGIISQWQRWAAYTFYMLLSTVAMAEYYALDPIPRWLLALIPGTAGMGMGVFVSLTANTGDGYADKVANLSVWGGVLIMALVPLFYINTNYSILGRWWRGFPIVVHSLYALLLWVILWVGPEVASDGSKFSRVAAAWFYLGTVLLWTLTDLAMVYFWRMGPPKMRTNATDSVIVDFDELEDAAEAEAEGEGTLELGHGKAPGVPSQRLANLDPHDPNYDPGTGTPLQQAPVYAGGRIPPLQHQQQQQQQQQQQHNRTSMPAGRGIGRPAGAKTRPRLALRRGR